VSDRAKRIILRAANASERRTDGATLRRQHRGHRSDGTTNGTYGDRTGDIADSPKSTDGGIHVREAESADIGDAKSMLTRFEGKMHVLQCTL